mmetsp:Transcript_47099/g.124046  ORF Transcript_47099/g.124046 Transcript_47099/m.124046 type:complete len:81 (-) Transcript_47099:891-1133(-)
MEPPSLGYEHSIEACAGSRTKPDFLLEKKNGSRDDTTLAENRSEKGRHHVSTLKASRAGHGSHGVLPPSIDLRPSSIASN